LLILFAEGEKEGGDQMGHESMVGVDLGAHQEQHLDLLKRHHLEQKQEKLKQQEEEEERTAEDLLDLDL
jgi:hypothetical protein